MVPEGVWNPTPHVTSVQFTHFILKTTMDCFEAPRMGLNLIFIKVSAAPTGALGPWKVEEP